MTLLVFESRHPRIFDPELLVGRKRAGSFRSQEGLGIGSEAEPVVAALRIGSGRTGRGRDVSRRDAVPRRTVGAGNRDPRLPVRGMVEQAR